MEEYITVILTKKEVNTLIQAIDDMARAIDNMDFYDDDWIFGEMLEEFMKIQAKLKTAKTEQNG